METLFAVAMAPAVSEGGQQPSLVSAMLPFVAMVAIFYFLLIRPQQKQQKQHQLMLSEIKKGDKVITSGGIHGLVANVKENIVSVKIADNVKIDVEKSTISKVIK